MAAGVIWFRRGTQLFSGTSYFCLFLVAAPLKMVFPKNGSLFSRVTEQLREGWLVAFVRWAVSASFSQQTLWGILWQRVRSGGDSSRHYFLGGGGVLGLAGPELTGNSQPKLFGLLLDQSSLGLKGFCSNRVSGSGQKKSAQARFLAWQLSQSCFPSCLGSKHGSLQDMFDTRSK